MDFSCDCGRQYSSKASLNRHKKVCSPSNQAVKLPFECKIDSFKTNYQREFLSHLKKDHNIEAESIEKEFDDYNDFLVWKEDYERETETFFKRGKKSKTSNGRIEYFICNRSGSYSPKRERTRAPRSQGTRKIGFKCPATMKAVIDQETKKVKLFVQPLHHGHDNRLVHLPLAKTEKTSIASQLSMGVSHYGIIQNIFSAPTTYVERKHLVTSQDVRNISRAYGVDQTARRRRDYFCVDFLVEEYQNDILLYKQQGEERQSIPPCISKMLEPTDFALGLMTSFQRGMLEKFGDQIVCLDSTHGTIFHDFNLITLLVKDEFQEGIPVAFLLSNRENSQVLSLFFEEIKKKVNVCPLIFMSDKDPQYFKSWEQVFKSNSQKLLCNWHVLQDWKKNIKKIKDKDTSERVYKFLCTILEEGDQEKFEVLLEKCMEQLQENPETVLFSEYFENEWYQIKTQWAKCYRVASGINTNRFLETFHRSLKYRVGYLKGKQGMRVEKCASILIQISKDLAAKWVLKLEKGKTTWEVSEINNRHIEATTLPKMLVKKTTDTTWNVDFSRSIAADTMVTSDLVYEVKKQPECKLECCMNCQPCGICLHSYHCDCPEGLLATSICKHIHLVVLFEKDQVKKMNQDTYKSDISLIIPDSGNAFLLNSINKEEDNIEVLKFNLLKKHQELLERIKNCNNRDALIATKEHLNRASFTIKMFDARKNYTDVPM